jgi:hypothetical protein
VEKESTQVNSSQSKFIADLRTVEYGEDEKKIPAK